MRPIIETASARDQIDVKLEIGGGEKDKLLLHYPAVKHGTGYVPPVVTLEFGGRATGEPHQVLPVTCDMDGHVQNVSFPTASPLVMSVARTFWKKATAAHVYCAQGRIRSERYARHWHDLAALGRSQYFNDAIADRAVATAVVQHKSFFFIEKLNAEAPCSRGAAVPVHRHRLARLHAFTRDLRSLRFDRRSPSGTAIPRKS